MLTAYGRRDAPSPASGQWPAIPGLGHVSLPPVGSLGMLCRLGCRGGLPFLSQLEPVIVQLTIGFSWCILSEAGLTYLGLGAQPPDASWGMVLNEGRSTLLISPWSSIYAGVFIAIAVLGFNFLGDGLRDILDPTLRHR